MHAGFSLHRRRRELIASIVLLGFAARALVPTGFMPAADHSFSLQICPAGFPAQLLRATNHAHRAYGSSGAVHHHGSSRAEHCAFAAVAGAAAVPNALATLASLVSALAPPFPVTHPVYLSQRFRIQQARGPPLLA